MESLRRIENCGWTSDRTLCVRRLRKQMSTTQPKTINFVVFKRRLTAEVRNYWYVRSAFEYSERWWNEDGRLDANQYITSLDGDNVPPFSGIDIEPRKYLSAKPDVLWSVRGNAITNIVTAFETYLYYLLKRAIFLKPSLIEDSGVEFSAGELASSYDTPDPREWLAEAVVAKYIRNNSHRKILKKIDKLIKGGFTNGEADLIDRWCRKVTLRNALIHNAKLVNKELVEEWPKKFSTIGQPIALDDGDVVRSHFVAYELAGKIDKQFQRAVIDEQDARTLARVLYLLDRTRSTGAVAASVFQIINYPFSKDMAESAVSYQKKSRAYIPDFNLIEEVVRDYQGEGDEVA